MARITDGLRERFGELDTRRRLVFASCIICMALPMGYFYSMGRTFVSIVDTFHTTRAGAAVIVSTTMACYMASGIISGILIERLGTRTCGILGSAIFCAGLMVSFWAQSVMYLIVSQGAIVGLGLSMIYICCYTVVGQTFDGMSSLLPISCVALASGVGGLIFPYLLEALIEAYGIRWTFLIIGGLNLNCLALSLMWPSKTNTRHRKAHQQKSLTDNFGIILRNKPFIIFALGITITTPALSIFLIFVADTILDNGFSNSHASLGLLLLSVSSTVGRPVPLLLKLPRAHPCPSLCIPLLTSILGIVGMLLMAFVRILSVNLVSCCFVGLSMGILIPCYAIISVRLVGSTLLPTAMGFLFSLMALGNISVPPFSGIIRDKTDSYKIVYIIAAAVMAVGGVFFLLAYRLKVSADKIHDNEIVTNDNNLTLLQDHKEHSNSV